MRTRPIGAVVGAPYGARNARSREERRGERKEWRKGGMYGGRAGGDAGRCVFILNGRRRGGRGAHCARQSLPINHMLCTSVCISVPASSG